MEVYIKELRECVEIREGVYKGNKKVNGLNSFNGLDTEISKKFIKVFIRAGLNSGDYFKPEEDFNAKEEKRIDEIAKEVMK